MTTSTSDDDDTTSSSNSTGAKLFASLMLVLAVIGSLVALTRPMQQRIDQLERSYFAHDKAMKADDERELTAAGQFSGLKATDLALAARIDTLTSGLTLRDQNARQLATLQTMSKEFARRLSITEAWTSHHDSEVTPKNTADDAAQWERIKALERDTYTNRNVD